MWPRLGQATQNPSPAGQISGRLWPNPALVAKRYYSNAKMVFSKNWLKLRSISINLFFSERRKLQQMHFGYEPFFLKSLTFFWNELWIRMEKKQWPKLEALSFFMIKILTYEFSFLHRQEILNIKTFLKWIVWKFLLSTYYYTMYINVKN